MIRCVKCGKALKRAREKHDCKQIRRQAIAGVTSEVERMKQRNMQGLKVAGDRGGAPPPPTDGLPGGSVPV